MSTVYLDKKGNVIKTDPGTQYHKDGTGPRNADGTPIVDAPIDTTADAADAADAAADDARPATAKKDAKK